MRDRIDRVRAIQWVHHHGCVHVAVRMEPVNPFLFVRLLSYPSSVQTLLIQNFTWISLQLSSCILWWHWLFKKILGLVLDWKSGLKVPLGPLCLLQTILLSDLVGSDGPLQIVMAMWVNFFQIWSVPNGHYFLLGLSSPTQQVQIQKNFTRRHVLSAEGCHTRLDGQHCPLRTYHAILPQGRRNPLKI